MEDIGSFKTFHYGLQIVSAAMAIGKGEGYVLQAASNSTTRDKG